MTETDSNLRCTDVTGPDWDLVPFDVPCARCGHDLLGLTAPVCPACKLEFDWSVAVPIEKLTCGKCEYHLFGLTETRCPECGTWFTWNEALDAYRRQQKPLFEYRWRERPVRSLIRTWFMALRPKRFWSTLDIHDPPQVRPLIVVAVIAGLVLAITVLVCMGLESWLPLVQTSGRNWAFPPRLRAPLPIADLPSLVLSALRDQKFYADLASATIWMTLSPIALLVFQQSMRMCKIRASHIIRVGVYSVPLLLPGMVPFGYVATIPQSMDPVWPYYDIKLLVALLILTYVTWSIRCAYVHYLRMPHAAAVAIASQAMAVLGTLFICWFIFPYSYAVSLIFDLEYLFWP